MKMLTPSDLFATIGTGMTTKAAAKMLRCGISTIHRAAHAYGIDLPTRPARIRGEEAWLEAFEKYGPAVRSIAQATGIDHRYVARQLERYGIKDTPEGRCGLEEMIARGVLRRPGRDEKTGQWTRPDEGTEAAA